MSKSIDIQGIQGSCELQFDVLFLGDMTRPGDSGLRLRQDILTCHDSKYSTAVQHLPVAGTRARVSNDLQRCVREGITTVLPPGTRAHARLAVVQSPGSLRVDHSVLEGLRADKVVLVIDQVPSPEQMGQWFHFAIGPMIWAPTNRWVRAGLARLGMSVPLTAADWRPGARPLEFTAPELRLGEGPVVGRVSAAGAAQWPGTADEVRATYPFEETIDFHVLGGIPKDIRDKVSGTQRWIEHALEHVSVERFLEPLDVFFYYPGRSVPELPEAAIAAAMISGKIVILPPHLRPHFGEGAIYAEPEEASAALARLFETPELLADARAAAVHHAGFQFSAKVKAEEFRALVGPGKARRQRRVQDRCKRVLFVPSNGVGMGHVTRLLALARRMPEGVQPIFASMSQSAQVIESFGFAARYFPSHKEIGSDLAPWDDWFRHELGDMIDRYDVDAVIYDGNNPTPGLVNAVRSHGRARLGWVRRGMGGPVASPFLDNARYCDLIIEPGEIAGELDTSPTALRRAEALVVDPIRLLDQDELLPRAEARSHLGLDPEAPVVFLQLGGGSTRDIVALVDEILEQLKEFESLQVVVAEWGSGLASLPRWPNVRVLRGFPLSAYFNAFDFSIAAAGYNAYHEVICFGLPTVFLPNRAPSMDDQFSRAEFAQDHGAGFSLPEDQMFHLRGLCELLITPEAREVVRGNCNALRQANGARQAAAAIANLVGAA